MTTSPHPRVAEATVLRSGLDTAAEQYRTNRAAALDLLDRLEEQLELARAGGGGLSAERHRARGRLPVRERVELLVDRDSAFLELSPLAAWGAEFPVGAGLLTGIGVVAGVECVVIAHDATARGGAGNPWSLRKSMRALEIARRNRLPVVTLVEPGGADLPSQAEIFVPGGTVFHELTGLSAMGIPTVALVFGDATAGGAYLPAVCDHAVLVDRQAAVFLGGPPLVRTAAGEDADEEQLGGAHLHARVSGPADHLAVDERDALRLGRRIISELNWRKLGPGPTLPADEPVHDPDELLGIAPADVRVPFDPRGVLARVVDGSRFGEYQAEYGTGLVTGWASVHGFPVGVLANARGVLFAEEANKAAEFVRLANQVDTPLLFLQNSTGYTVGTRYEQGGIVEDRATVINAVATSTVPHLTVNLAAGFGAGMHGMSGRAFDPRLAFAWPRAFDEAADDARRREVAAQIDAESHAFAVTGRLHDDGVLDPRDTRTALGIALSAAHSAPVEGRRGFGVFRR